MGHKMKGVCGGIVDKSPQSERKVYEALKETFPKEWHAWHSVKYRTEAIRFKGLERPAIVVTDLRYLKDRLGTRMKIALTRALGVVRIVGEFVNVRNMSVMSEICPFHYSWLGIHPEG